MFGGAHRRKFTVLLAVYGVHHVMAAPSGTGVALCLKSRYLRSAEEQQEGQQKWLEGLEGKMCEEPLKSLVLFSLKHSRLREGLMAACSSSWLPMASSQS